MKVIFVALVFAFMLPKTVALALPSENTTVTASAGSAIAEAKYDRLMRIYVNKLKLAFVQPDDEKTIAILREFNDQFAQQTEVLKTEFSEMAKQLSKKEAAELYNRIHTKSRNEEVIALLFDERITSHTSSNPEIEKLLDALRAKSLEIQNADLVALAR